MEPRIYNGYTPTTSISTNSISNEPNGPNLKHASDYVSGILTNPFKIYYESDHPFAVSEFMKSILASSKDSVIPFWLDGRNYCLWSSNGDMYVSHSREEAAQGKVLCVGHFNIHDLMISLIAEPGVMRIFCSSDAPSFYEKEALAPLGRALGQEAAEGEESSLHDACKNQSTPVNIWEGGDKLRTAMDIFCEWESSIVDKNLSEDVSSSRSQIHLFLDTYLRKNGADIHTAIDFARYAMDENCETYALLINPNIDRVLSLPKPSRVEVSEAMRQEFSQSDPRGWTIEQLSSALDECMRSPLRDKGTVAFIFATVLMQRRENFAQSLPNYHDICSLKFSKDITPLHFKSKDISFHTTQNGKKINPKDLETIGCCLLGAINAVDSTTRPAIRINIHDERIKNCAFTSRIGGIIEVNVSAAQIHQGMGSIMSMLAHELGVHSFSYSLSGAEKDAEELEPQNVYEATIADHDFTIQHIPGNKQQPDHLTIALDAFFMLGNNFETAFATRRGQMYRATVIGMIHGLEASPSWTSKEEKDNAKKEILATYCLDVARIVVTNDTTDLSNLLNNRENAISVAMKAYQLMKQMFPDDLHNVEITMEEMTEYAMKGLISAAKDLAMSDWLLDHTLF
ncbi:hypothetical protein EO087_05985 [Dyella sp. M7H15-1]|uniref:hypothetical protein n=1 Tax=Dyella sp. M7H15-1 TaxID=2501295 RepID=UPI0010051981|nr:hypothetical protein [Dyella sp. M7H15-1]QAU23588.1 hypothetical protein EO087_05985 [Dyella sp. M7H15-1]